MNKKALALAIGSGILLAPVFGIAWLLFSAWLSLTNGGSFGGYGTGTSDAAEWVEPVAYLLLTLVVLLHLAICVYVYRLTARRKTSR